MHLVAYSLTHSPHACTPGRRRRDALAPFAPLADRAPGADEAGLARAALGAARRISRAISLDLAPAAPRRGGPPARALVLGARVHGGDGRQVGGRRQQPGAIPPVARIAHITPPATWGVLADPSAYPLVADHDHVAAGAQESHPRHLPAAEGERLEPLRRHRAAGSPRGVAISPLELARDRATAPSKEQLRQPCCRRRLAKLGGRHHGRSRAPRRLAWGKPRRTVKTGDSRCRTKFLHDDHSQYIMKKCDR